MIAKYVTVLTILLEVFAVSGQMPTVHTCKSGPAKDNKPEAE